MTTEQAMRLLCEALETMPTEKGRVFGAPHYTTSASPNYWWAWQAKWEAVANAGNTGLTGSIDNGSWQPVNFLTSDSASARLLKVMLADRNLAMNRFSIFPWTEGGDESEFVIHGTQIHVGRTYVRHNKFETAIFLAALAWKGIERPTDI